MGSCTCSMRLLAALLLAVANVRSFPASDNAVFKIKSDAAKASYDGTINLAEANKKRAAESQKSQLAIAKRSFDSQTKSAEEQFRSTESRVKDSIARAAVDFDNAKKAHAEAKKPPPASSSKVPESAKALADSQAKVADEALARAEALNKDTLRQLNDELKQAADSKEKT